MPKVVAPPTTPCGRCLPAGRRDPARPAARRWAVDACALVAALPALLAALAAVGVDWTPASDYGPIEVRVRDVLSTHPPLVGAYSRLGGNHPGPALFYVLAGPYRLLGSQPWALLVGAGLVHAASAAAAVRIAGRRGRLGAAALLAALVVGCSWGLGPDLLRDPWNPRLPLLAFLLAAVATWAVLDGSARSLPVAVAATSFCVQAHVSYAALGLVLVAALVVGVARHRRDRAAWRRPLLAAAAVALALWAPVLVQQAAGDDPNLGRIVAGAAEGDGPGLGAGGAADRLLAQLGPRPAWDRAEPADPLDRARAQGLGAPPVGLAVVLAGVALAVRRRDGPALALLALTAALWAAGAWSLARITGLPAPYLWLWVHVLGLLAWFAGLWAVGRAVAPLVPASPRVRRAGAVAAVGAVAVTALAVAAAGRGPVFAEYRARYAGAARLADATRVALRPHPGAEVELRTSGALVYDVPAVVAELERAGHQVRVAPPRPSVWGGTRTPGPAPDVVVTLVSGRAPAGVPGARRVASVDGRADGEPRPRPIAVWLALPP